MIRYDAPTLADAEELDAMAVQIWMETFGHGYKDADLNAYLTHAYGPTGRLRADLADPAIRWQLAYAGDAIVGYAKVTAPWLEQAQPGEVQLSQLYVASGWHGKGIAPALMDWAFTTARADNAPALLLTVFEENARAIAFYAKYGFVHIGDYAFPIGEKVDRDLIMRLAL